MNELELVRSRKIEISVLANGIKHSDIKKYKTTPECELMMVFENAKIIETI